MEVRAEGSRAEGTRRGFSTGTRTGTNSELLLFNTTRARARMVPGPPSTGVAIAMDGGMELGKDMKRTRPANSYLFTKN